MNPEQTIAVSDSSPLILYSHIERLELLQEMFDRILIPPAVWEEVVIRGANRPGATDVMDASWIHNQALSDPIESSLASSTLGPGETEAISLAKELGGHYPILLDDRRARYLAVAHGLDVIGSAGILMRAKRRGIVSNIQPLLNELQDAGLYLSEAFIRDLLSSVGEF